MNFNDEALGIFDYGLIYLELKDNQDYLEEFIRIDDFIKKAIKDEKIINKIGYIKSYKFINYGYTQLIFVAKNNLNEYYTLVVNQPATKYKTSKIEYNNLNKLNKINSNLVIKPIIYYNYNNLELYITKYYYQSRCIGISTNEWGMWIPEPNYHFKKFNEKEKSIINTSIVASLIKLYDLKNNKALTNIRLDEGDFMLLKEYESKYLTYENISNNLKLIAARKIKRIKLIDYINRIKIELLNNNLNKDNMIIIDKNLLNVMSKNEVENGIEIGLKSLNKKFIERI